MSTNQDLLIDNQYLSERGITVLEYIEPALGTPKDGGGTSLDNVHGLVETSSTAINATQGQLTIFFTAINEKLANEKRRSFIAWFRNEKFRKISTKTDSDYFRWGMLLSQKGEMKIVHQIDSSVYCEISFNIQYRDSFQYQREPTTVIAKLENINELNETGLRSKTFVNIKNTGRTTRNLKFTFELKKSIVSLQLLFRQFKVIFKKYEYNTYGTLVENVSKRRSIEFGMHNNGYINFTNYGEKPSLNMATGEATQWNLLQFFKSGTFFEIENGEYGIEIQFRATDPDSSSIIYPMDIKIELVNTYE